MAKDDSILQGSPCLRSLVCVAGIALATGLRASPLTTAAELAAVNRGEDTRATDFALTATLVRICAPEKTDSLCIADDSGYTNLRLPFNLRPKGLAAGCFRSYFFCVCVVVLPFFSIFCLSIRCHRSHRCG